MKIKALLSFIILLTVSTLSYGQLIERENVDARIKTGTRPVKGNFGFMIGPSFQELEEITDKDLDIKGYPLMSFKYYLTDQFELRLSTQVYGTSEKFEGTLVNEIGLEDRIDKETFIRFMPSAQYHFASSNFLDTYAGVGFIIGSEKSEVLTNEKTNLTGDFYADHLTKKTFVWGISANFGMQTFVADLPFSIGAEVGIRSIYHSKLQYEHNFRSSVGGVTTELTFFTLDESSTLRYQSLEYEKFEVGADLRLLLTYYFRK